MSGPSAPAEGGLTRELLLSGALPGLVAQAHPEARVKSDAERAASLAATLAAKPDAAGGVWVFAYGSLIWNPLIRFTQRAVAHVPGWHRAFCLSTKAGRGTPEHPGLMLGLRPGAACAGVAFHIAEDEVATELDLLWRREMVADGYIPVWVRLLDEAGREFGHAIAFGINPEGPTYAGDLADEVVAHRLALARGSLGTGAEYLFRTRDGLRSLGIHDPFVERIATLVADLLSPERA